MISWAPKKTVLMSTLVLKVILKIPILKVYKYLKSFNCQMQVLLAVSSTASDD